MQRYTKTHFLVRHRARLPPGILDEGAAFWQRPCESFLEAMAQGDLFVTSVAVKIREAIEQSLLSGVRDGSPELLGQDVIGAGERSSIRQYKPSSTGKTRLSTRVGGSLTPAAQGALATSAGGRMGGTVVEEVRTAPGHGGSQGPQILSGDVPSYEVQNKAGGKRQKRAARRAR